jgi:ribosome-associated toxin RatA of RatAB toxin-antitoxin module
MRKWGEYERHMTSQSDAQIWRCSTKGRMTLARGTVVTRAISQRFHCRVRLQSEMRRHLGRLT